MDPLDPADGWQLQHWWTHDQRVLLKRGEGSGLAASAAVLRSAFSQLRNATPSQLLQELRDTGGVDLGEMSCLESFAIREIAERLGYEVITEDRSREHWFPVNPITSMACLIDSDDEFQAVLREMIAAGARVVEFDL